MARFGIVNTYMLNKCIMFVKSIPFTWVYGFCLCLALGASLGYNYTQNKIIELHEEALNKAIVAHDKVTGELQVMTNKADRYQFGFYHVTSSIGIAENVADAVLDMVIEDAQNNDEQ